MGNEFRRIGASAFYRSFHFRAYLNCLVYGLWKRGIGMVLAPEYSDNKKKNGKNKIETVMNSIQFPLLDRTAPNSVISTTLNDPSNGQDSPVYGRFSMVPVVASLNLLH
ncbi:hypothetical protein HAX54_029271 [Datura stramonium]|uniref:Uncharacterized protein n=1 Tax=Datura stramonium TaxID=4076 RepID=A0ABS8V876_DATST|nr:hypothetical protein [Datura stramonium]